MEAMAWVARELALALWVDDERCAQWHPGPSITLRVEISGELGSDHDTFLVCEVPAAFRPDGVPDEVLDHVHGEESCGHVMVPFVSGYCCDVCGNQFTRWRLCPRRCVATGYAVGRVLESYTPPGGRD